MTLRDRLFVWFLRKFTAYTLKMRAKRLLRSQGFIVYCECGRILNEHAPVTPLENGWEVFLCWHCGKRTTFDFDSCPVPVKVNTPCDNITT